MKKLAIMFLLCSFPAFAQNGRWDLQGTTTQAQGGNLLPVYAIPGASVSFFACSSNVPSSCTNAAVTYNGAGTACPSTTPVNPQNSLACTGKSDTAGNFGAWFSAGTYAYSLTASGKKYGPFLFSVGSGSGGNGTVTHTAGALTAGSLIMGNGAGDITTVPGADWNVSQPGFLTIPQTSLVSTNPFPFNLESSSTTGSLLTILNTSSGFQYAIGTTGSAITTGGGGFAIEGTAGKTARYLYMYETDSTHPVMQTGALGVWGWSSNNSALAAVADTGLSRNGPATVAIGNGTQGNASGSLLVGALTDSGLTAGQCVQAGIGGLLGSVACGGSVVNFGAGDLSPLFTTTVTSSTSNPFLAFTASTAAQNSFLSGPSSGGTGAYSFRAIVPADVPTLNQSTTGTAGGLTGAPAIAVSNITDSALTAGTSPICPNGSGGLFTTTGCAAMPLYSPTGTLQATPHLVIGTATLVGGTLAVTLTSNAVYTSSSSYVCSANDLTALQPVQVAYTSGSAFTLTGTTTDVIRYNCAGN